MVHVKKVRKDYISQMIYKNYYNRKYVIETSFFVQVAAATLVTAMKFVKLYFTFFICIYF